MVDARRRAEEAAQTSYGRLLLVARTRDVTAAEDALSEAFVSALKTWPERGVPMNPDAWLLTAARNSLADRARHAARGDALLPDLDRHFAELGAGTAEFPDERLKLFFVCAHPAIDPAIRAPLILQTVLGLPADRIARALLISPGALGQRLVRAKTKIRAAGLRVAVPSPDDLRERLDDVLTAIYAAFGVGWDVVPGSHAGFTDLTEEAIYLARLLTGLLPGEAEAHGLLALMLYCHARRAARRDAAGDFVPLEDQDVTLWDRAMLLEAEASLTHAASYARMGRYQCEAAIQSVHCQRLVTGSTNYAALRLLYKLLLTHYPSIGAAIGYAAVLVRVGEAATALELLDGLLPDRIASHQPYWVVRAHVLRALSRAAESEAVLEMAVGLSEDAAVRRFIRGTIARQRQAE